MADASHSWRFFRAGGFDQVQLDSAADLLALGELDQKLWVALSCPVKGIEFDARSLQLIDSDNDGHVRAPELLAAIAWAGSRLTSPDVLVQKCDGVPIALIRTNDDTGKAIQTAALALAKDLGKTEADVLTVAEASAAQASHAARALAAWEAAGVDALPLGEATAAAQALVTELDAKVQDYFTRCQLAAFDERAGGVLNASEDALKALAPSSLQASTDAIVALPLSHVSADAKLALSSGINPAWAARVATLRDTVVTPLLGAQDSLTACDWQSIQDKLAAYTTWLAAKPDAAAAEGDGLRDLEKLARYVRDLLPLANNFVAFKDFYTCQGKGTFQIGTLYLDGRSCELVVAVNDAAKHAALAALSRMCLVYCDCVRGAEKVSIAAAFTAGDSDQLMVGRNGVFYDRQGRDWDATISKIIDQPISLRQAFWSPYKQVARLVGTQLQKLAASKAAAADDKLAKSATGHTQAAAAGAPPAPPAFDVGKFAGIFAAIGLALGAIGTMVVSVMSGLFALAWWQLPLVIVGLMLIISLPAVVLAWFKLRSRNLGPLLDANGWAINARARINIPFGTSLTQVAQLPANAQRNLSDPYADKPASWPYLVLMLLVAAAVMWFLRFRG